MKFGFLNQLFGDEEFEELFKHFDFNLLDDPEFKEDAVREEIVFPVLKQLGYTASGENKIVRSKTLKHPFYYFGTKKYNVNIIPDYTFQVKNENKWILDAKRPTENITSGKNVFQAYSYAMHPEIQSDIYSLCNGREWVVFNVKKHEPILHFELKDLVANWKKLLSFLDPEIVVKPHLRDFSHDLGLFLLKVGDLRTVLEPFEFRIEDINDIAKIEDDLYTINEIFTLPDFGKERFMGTFDFNQKRYDELLKILPEGISSEIKRRLLTQPFRYSKLEPPKSPIKIMALLGHAINRNENEDYLPFDVIEFKK